MTILYHFTCIANARAIFKSQTLKKGVIVNAAGSGYDKAVCLTSDVNPDGHGLPDGREVTEAQSRKLGYRLERQGRLYAINHTEIRLSVEIQSGNPKLVSAAAHYAGTPRLLEALEIAAFSPMDPDISIDDQARTQRALKEGNLRGKGSTWWYYFGEIPLSSVLAVAIKDSDGNYLMGSPEAFASEIV